MRPPAPAVLLILTTAFSLPRPLAAAPEDDPARADRERLQGTWEVTAMELDGTAVPAADLATDRLRIQGDAYSLSREGRVVERGTLALDASIMPRRMDITVTEGEDKDKSQPAIYAFDGERLKLCVAPPGAKERPERFATQPGSGMALLVLKRVAP